MVLNVRCKVLAALFPRGALRNSVLIDDLRILDLTFAWRLPIIVFVAVVLKSLMSNHESSEGRRIV
jgi:hypothetical protein